MPRLPFRPAPLALSIFLALGTAVAHAQRAPANTLVSISIAAQPLAQALNELARQTGLELIVQPALVAGKTAAPVSGQLTAGQALDRLLAGSGLDATVQDGAVIVKPRVGPASPGASTSTLPTVNVVATPEAVSGYRARATSTASKLDIPMLEEAQVVNVVTPQLIADYQVHSLDDLARFASGVVQSNTYGSTEDGLIKRGFGTNTDGSILRDGARSAVQHKFSATAEKVEILKGPASLLYGVLEPGGVVNIVSKRPQYRWHTELKTEASSDGGGTTMIDVTGPISDTGLAFRMVAERKEEDYWRNFGTNKNTLIAPSISYVNDKLDVLVAYEHNKYTQPYDRGTVFVDGKPAATDYYKRFDEAWSVAAGENDNLNVQASYKLDDAWQAKLNYNWSKSLYDDSMARPVGLRPLPATPGTFRRRADGNRDVDEQVQYLSMEMLGRTQWLGMKHDLVVGVDAEHNDEHRGDSLRGPNNDRLNIYNPVYGNQDAPSVVDNPTSAFISEIHSRSVYVKDNWHLNDQWIVALGGRYQTFDHYYGIGRPFRKLTDVEESVFLPFGGLVYKLNEQVSLYGNYSRSFVPNRADETTGQGFAPERGRSVEVGMKFDLARGIGGTVAVYDLVKQNVVVSMLDATGNSVSRAVGRARARGLEADLSAELGKSWDLIGTYAYTDTLVLDDPIDQGNKLQNVPQHAASLYLTHKFGMSEGIGQWTMGGGARYVGKRAGDTGNAFWLDDYTVADAFVRWQGKLSNTRTRVQLNVNNLFDKHYYPSSAGDIRVAVGRPREIRLSVSAEF